jgi:hypothetical protein
MKDIGNSDQLCFANSKIVIEIIFVTPGNVKIPD